MRLDLGRTDLQTILTDHDKDYGEFKRQGIIAQTLKVTIKQYDGWYKLAADQREALDMIANKLSRILNGNPDLPDHWHDIAGYAELIYNRLQKEKEQREPQSDRTRR